jgi:hypothetical protein
MGCHVPHVTGPGPYLPKPHHLYVALESSYSPKRPNILTSNEDAYWKAVRQAAAPCFSMSSLKQVRSFLGLGGGQEPQYGKQVRSVASQDSVPECTT